MSHLDDLVAAMMAAPRVEVELDGVLWSVAPMYVAPVAIGKAARLAEVCGCELPTPALVDAIWRAADLQIVPIVRSVANGLLRDWGPSMDAPATHANQAHRLNVAIGERPYTLLAGAFKDVVDIDGELGLYGWHVADGVAVDVATHPPATPGPGRVIQQPNAKAHGPGYRDYSQGLRLVRRL